MFEQKTYRSHDGLTLAFRDYPGTEDRDPLVCIAGLSRNASDFDAFAAGLAGRRRILCPDLRGRGLSQWAPDPSTYRTSVYVDDVLHLMDEAGVARAVLVGTSLGGFVAMVAAGAAKDRIGGLIINDVGPDEAGADPVKIAAFLRGEAASPDGRRDFDPDLAGPFEAPGGPEPYDRWTVFGALEGLPILVVRGALSPILSARTAARMQGAIRGVRLVEVPDVGHFPTLAEPVAAAAVDAFLA